ncbi:MAG: hypothetical protein KC431_10325 [Myxococcales bacterium]|nr:hypothetical protein [Myxococcales bacterium]
MPTRATHAGWGLALALGLGASSAEASPPPDTAPVEAGDDRSEHVIPAGREQAATALLAELVADTQAPLSWRGPTIDFDRIKWWLERDGQARGMLILLPAALAEAGEPTSESFALRVAWAPDYQPNAEDIALMDRALAAVRQGDHGQFYIVRLELFENEFTRELPYFAPTEVDSAGNRRRWGWRLAGLAVLGLLALAAAMRPTRASESN